jgi:hypothetical protein
MDIAKDYFKPKPVATDDGQKELTLNLHIKSLTLPVTELMKVYILWNRGNK